MLDSQAAILLLAIQRGPFVLESSSAVADVPSISTWVASTTSLGVAGVIWSLELRLLLAYKAPGLRCVMPLLFSSHVVYSRWPSSELSSVGAILFKVVVYDVSQALEWIRARASHGSTLL